MLTTSIKISAGVLLLISVSTGARAENCAERLYVQATAGSFSDEAAHKITAACDVPPGFYFSGVPENTLRRASEHQAPALIAVANPQLPSGLGDQSIDALTRFQITRLIAAIELPIRLCLWRKTGLGRHLPTLKTVASHPAALAQMSVWLQKHHLQAVPVAGGTSVAAQALVSGHFDNTMGVVGSCELNRLYSGLEKVAAEVEDKENQPTLFLMVYAKPRDQMIEAQMAREQLADWVNKARALLAEKTPTLAEPAGK